MGEHPPALKEHIRGCKECATAHLRAIFNARPFIDTGSRYLDDMCNEGKRIAAEAWSTLTRLNTGETGGGR